MMLRSARSLRRWARVALWCLVGILAGVACEPYDAQRVVHVAQVALPDPIAALDLEIAWEAAPLADAVGLATPAGDPYPVSGRAAEVIHASAFTYLRVADDGAVLAGQWLAAAQVALEVGDAFHAQVVLEVPDFQSPSTGRRFERLYFVEELVVGPGPAAVAVAAPAQAILTVPALLALPPSPSADAVSVVGYVDRVNAAVMGVDWLHLRATAESAEPYLCTVGVVLDPALDVGQVVAGEQVVVHGHLRPDAGVVAGRKGAEAQVVAPPCPQRLIDAHSWQRW